MRLACLASLVCIGLALAGCAGTPGQSSENPAWQQRVSQLSKLSHWRASGKLALRTPEQSQSGNLDWTQDRHNTHILLSGPLGMGATAIVSDQKTLRLTQDGDTRVYDISANGQTGTVPGWDLPLQALPHWIMGLPAPQSPVTTQILENELMQQLQQDGWTITYQLYGQFGQYMLPTRIKIVRGGTQARLVLRNWTEFSY